MMTDNMQFIESVLRTAIKYGTYDDLTWFEEDGEILVAVVCSDMFFWGTADQEELTPDNLSDYEQAIQDMDSLPIDGLPYRYYGGMLFCARQRKMRPQGAAYPPEPESEAWKLFDACGPERETGFGNPYEPGQYRR